jgi:hypothetical protein
MAVALGGPVDPWSLSRSATMTIYRLYRSFSIVFGAILISSCSDSILQAPTAPMDAAAAAGSGAASKGPGGGGSLNDSQKLKALWWSSQHQAVVSVSQSIDENGGTISMPATGLTIYFPPGALSSPLTITVTSDERYVAYKMEPSGTRFNKDVIVTQQLALTQVAGSLLHTQLFAAYIADDRAKLSGKIPVLEIEPSSTTLSPLTHLPETQVWVIRHFSRYMLASG